MHVSVYTRLFSEPFRITEPEFVHIAEDARQRGDAPAECSALIDLAFARIHMGQASKALPPIQREKPLCSSLNRKETMVGPS